VQFVDEDGERLLHRCSGLAAAAEHQHIKRGHLDHTATTAAAAAVTASAAAAAAPRLSKAEVFSLSSRPSAQKKILLDFDGHVTTNSKWNSASQPTITSPAWDTDGDPTSFSGTELAQIKTIWSIVAEGETHSGRVAAMLPRSVSFARLHTSTVRG
jgi:hypothetical protein